jgi:hypothetical protein
MTRTFPVRAVEQRQLPALTAGSTGVRRNEYLPQCRDSVASLITSSSNPGRGDGGFFETVRMPPRSNPGSTCTPLSRHWIRGTRVMDHDDFLREEAVRYRRLAEQSTDEFVKKELLELAVICEELADTIEDRLTGG